MPYYDLKQKHVDKLAKAAKLLEQAAKLERQISKNERRLSEAAYENALDRSERMDEQAQKMISEVLRQLVKL